MHNLRFLIIATTMHVEHRFAEISALGNTTLGKHIIIAAELTSYRSSFNVEKALLSVGDNIAVRIETELPF